MEATTGSQEAEQGKQEFDMTDSVQAVCRICGKTDKEHTDPVPGENLSTQHFFEPDSVQCNGKCRFSNYVINTEVPKDAGTWDQRKFQVIDPSCPKHGDSVQAGKGTWQTDEWIVEERGNGEAYFIRAKKSGQSVAGFLHKHQMLAIITDHERAAWAAEARDMLAALLQWDVVPSFIEANELLAHYPQQEGN